MNAVLGRVGVIGDAHAEDDRVARVLAFFETREVDAVLCVGDVIDGFGDDNRTVRLLESTLAVRGNHERWFLESEMRFDHPERPGSLDERTRRWCDSLPAQRPLKTAAGDALLCHGVGEDDMVLLLPEHDEAALGAIATLEDVKRRYAFMICGHTHRRMVRRIDDLTVFNAGTLDRRSHPGCLLIDFRAREARFFDVFDRGAPTPSSFHRF